jgi:quinol monooxygenase YgiN
MGGHVSWVFEVAIKPGQLEAFEALVCQMVESTRSESGALVFEWYVSGDGSVGQIYERYADSAATLIHLHAFGEKFAARLMAAVDPTRFTVLGTPSDDVRGALSGFGPTYLRPVGGFAR